MKSRFFIFLMFISAISSGFAGATAVSTLAQRDAMVKEAFKGKTPEDALKEINKKQQDGDVKADNQDYVVIVKKESSDQYIRVAHYQSDKLNKAIELVLVDVMTKAEEKLAGSSGPADFEFSAGERKMYAVIEKRGEYLIFNICPTKDEVEGLLKASAKPDTASAVVTEPAASKEEKKEELKSEVKVEPVTTTPETSSAVASVSETPVTIIDAAKSAADTDTQRVHQ